MPRRSSLFPYILLASAALVSLPVVLGLLGRVHPLFDAFSHFRMHLAVLLGLCGLALLASRFRLEGLVSIALTLGAAATLRDFLPILRAAAAASSADASAHRLLHANIRYDNTDTSRLTALIEKFRPDIVTLAEVTPRWARQLDVVRTSYPHQIVCPSTFGFGAVAIFSVLPFAGDPAKACSRDGRAVFVSVDFGDRTVDVAAIHLAWPWPYEQPRHIRRLKPRLASLGETSIVAGDFNAVSWSAAVDRVAAAGRLSLVPGVGATWLHRKLPRGLNAWIGLPIDHILTKGALRILDASTGEPIGSDHLPVMVTFELSPQPLPPTEARASGAVRPATIQ